MAEAALSFLGLRASHRHRLGAMVADGRDFIRAAPWVSFAPGIAIGLAVLGFNLVATPCARPTTPSSETKAEG